MFSWMAIPLLLFAYGWVLLVNPNNGVPNNLARRVFGFERGPFSPYSMTALMVISGMGLTPTACVMIIGLSQNMDPVLEQAGLIHGASRWKVLTSITLPLLRPGTLSVAMYLIMAMAQSFDIPLIIGLSARIPVLSTRIYALALPEGAAIPNYGLAAAFGVLLFLIALFLMWIYFRATRVGESYRVVSGKGVRPRRAKLGIWRFDGLTIVFTYLAIMISPVVNLFWTSLSGAIPGCPLGCFACGFRARLQRSVHPKGGDQRGCPGPVQLNHRHDDFLSCQLVFCPCKGAVEPSDGYSGVRPDRHTPDRHCDGRTDPLFSQPALRHGLDSGSRTRFGLHRIWLAHDDRRNDAASQRT